MYGFEGPFRSRGERLTQVASEPVLRATFSGASYSSKTRIDPSQSRRPPSPTTYAGMRAKMMKDLEDHGVQAPPGMIRTNYLAQDPQHEGAQPVDGHNKVVQRRVQLSRSCSTASNSQNGWWGPQDAWAIQNGWYM